MQLKTKNLDLLACDVTLLESAIEGNASLARKLGMQVPEDWTQFGVEALQYAVHLLESHRGNTAWTTYFPIHRADQCLIGCAGFKGKPTEDGLVEIGYEISPAYRQKGYATEIAQALIEFAFGHHQVSAVLAHTLAFNNPSTRILEKCGFVKTGSFYDPDDGDVWAWRLDRNQSPAS